MWLFKPYKKNTTYECKLKTQSTAKTAGWCREKEKEKFFSRTLIYNKGKNVYEIEQVAEYISV